MEESKGVILPLFYNPPSLLFLPFLDSEGILFDDLEPFEKKTGRTVSQLISSQGPFKLRIPVQAFEKGSRLNGIRLDANSKWNIEHWRFLKTNYGKAPYFHFLEPYIEPIFLEPPEHLARFNYELIKLCLKVLRIDITSDLMSGLVEKPSESRRLDTQATEICLGKYDGIQKKNPISYPQLFGKTFVHGMGILDLVFCQGPDGKAYLKKVREQLGDFWGLCGKNF